MAPSPLELSGLPFSWGHLGRCWFLFKIPSFILFLSSLLVAELQVFCLFLLWFGPGLGNFFGLISIWPCGHWSPFSFTFWSMINNSLFWSGDCSLFFVAFQLFPLVLARVLCFVCLLADNLLTAQFPFSLCIILHLFSRVFGMFLPYGKFLTLVGFSSFPLSSGIFVFRLSVIR